MNNQINIIAKGGQVVVNQLKKGDYFIERIHGQNHTFRVITDAIMINGNQCTWNAIGYDGFFVNEIVTYLVTKENESYGPELYYFSFGHHPKIRVIRQSDFSQIIHQFNHIIAKYFIVDKLRTILEYAKYNCSNTKDGLEPITDQQPVLDYMLSIFEFEDYFPTKYYFAKHVIETTTKQFPDFNVPENIIDNFKEAVKYRDYALLAGAFKYAQSLSNFNIEETGNLKESAQNCPHLSFKSQVNVFRLTESDESDIVTGYKAEIEIWCNDCKMPFAFKGLPGGVNPDSPTVCAESLTARMPITPISNL